MRQSIARKLASYRELTSEQRAHLAQQSAENRALLEAFEAQDALFRALETPPLPAAARGRILARATRVSASPSTVGPLPTWISPTRAWATVAIVLLLALFATTGYVAAGSLPGDALYSVKRSGERVQLALRLSQTSRDTYQQRLDQRRRAEVRTLLAKQRDGIEVAFVGTVAQSEDGAWFVSEVPVALATAPTALLGEAVYTEGVTYGGVVQVRTLSRPQEHGQPEPPSVPSGPGEPTRQPTHAPSPSASPQPTGRPTQEPTDAPRPTAQPTHVPTQSKEPTAQPTRTHTQQPNPGPTGQPGPTSQPEPGPTAAPSAWPTSQPGPTDAPTYGPTASPGPTSTHLVGPPSYGPTSEPGPTAEPDPGPTGGPGPRSIAAPEPPGSPTPTARPTGRP